MPAARYYTVTQTREVRVRANGLIEAAKAADCVFHGMSANEPGSAILGSVQERAMDIQEEDHLGSR